MMGWGERGTPPPPKGQRSDLSGRRTGPGRGSGKRTAVRADGGKTLRQPNRGAWQHCHALFLTPILQGGHGNGTQNSALRPPHGGGGQAGSLCRMAAAGAVLRRHRRAQGRAHRLRPVRRQPHGRAAPPGPRRPGQPQPAHDQRLFRHGGRPGPLFPHVLRGRRRGGRSDRLPLFGHGLAGGGQRLQHRQGPGLDGRPPVRGLHFGGSLRPDGPARPPGARCGGAAAHPDGGPSGEELHRRAPRHGGRPALPGLPHRVHRRGRL